MGLSHLEKSDINVGSFVAHQRRRSGWLSG
jgi:hypothetical protein